MKTYRDWPILETMPEGWKIDKTAGSPLAGHAFVTNGKSVLKGQKRALLLVRKPQADMFTHEVPRIELKPELPEAVSSSGKQWKHFDAPCARTVNELAREKFKLRLLNDILCDLQICEIEGWCKREYIAEIKSLINSIGQKDCIEVVCSKMETTTSKMETVGT